MNNFKSNETDAAMSSGRLVVNIDTREVFYNYHRANNLTNKEFEILRTLARQPQRVYSKQELEHALYESSYAVSDRVLGVHISNLRAKLPDPAIIETIYGIGYKLTCSVVKTKLAESS